MSIAQRGLFIGNRGIIHDPATKTLLGRRWTTKAWLVCVLDYKGRHREVMGGRSWTELFFLDEAVAHPAAVASCSSFDLSGRLFSVNRGILRSGENLSPVFMK